MKEDTNKPTRAHHPESEVPANPLPAPLTGDANLVESIDQAEQATWQVYRSSTLHAEPPGHLDPDGLMTQNSMPLTRQRHLRESTDKDE